MLTNSIETVDWSTGNSTLFFVMLTHSTNRCELISQLMDLKYWILSDYLILYLRCHLISYDSDC